MSTLLDALASAQAEMPDLVKDSENPHFSSTFISLKGLLEQVMPVLRKHGLMLLQPPTTIASTGGPAMTTQILHVESGESLTAETPLILDKTTAQAHGSAITYLRRYMLMSLLGLVADEDDDGNAASRGTRRRTPPKPAAATAAAPPAHDADDGPF
jgi:hypothetical protein